MANEPIIRDVVTKNEIVNNLIDLLERHNHAVKH